MDGVYVCQYLSFVARLGRPTKESQGQNRTGEIPPSGIVGGLAESSCSTGTGLRPIGKPLELPPDPIVIDAPHFYPDRHCKIHERFAIASELCERPAIFLFGVDWGLRV